MTDREQFEEERRSVIGATDISAIVNKSPYGRTGHDVYMDKLRLGPPIKQTTRMRMGLHNEPLIADLYAEQTGLRPGSAEFCRMKTHPFIGGHPDYLVYNGDLNRGLECKYVAWLDPEKWGEAGSDKIPEGFFIQCQWYMMLTGLDLWDLAVLDGGGSLRIYPLERHARLIDHLLKEGRSFWINHVIPKVPPPVDSSESASKMLKAVWPQHTEEVKEATPEINDYAADERLAYARLKHCQEHHRGLVSQLQAFMEDAGRLNTGVGRYLWRTTNDSEKVDWKGVAYEVYLKLATIVGTPMITMDTYAANHTTIKPGHRRFTPPPKEKNPTEAANVAMTKETDHE